MNSIVLVDKPAGITSFDVIKKLKTILGEKKIGHSGVLDKMATGLLVCGTAKATKLLSIFEESYKIYIAELTLGVETDTYDITGNVLKVVTDFDISKDNLYDTIKKFEGEITQKPPPFSNIKYKGKKLYKYALRGENVDIKPRVITVYKIKLVDFCKDKVIIKVKCSKGTYIRSLAHDIGEELGCGATVSKLRRVYVYPFSVDDASFLDNPRIIPLEEALYFINGIVVNEDSEKKIKNGINPCIIIDCSNLKNKRYKILNKDGKVLAIIEKSMSSYSYRAVLI